MPKKFKPSKQSGEKSLQGKAFLFAKLNQEIKILEQQKKDLREEIIALTLGTLDQNEDLSYTMQTDTIDLELATRKTEKFNVEQALEELSLLPPKVASQYYMQTTTPDLIGDAFRNDHLDADAVKRCYSETESKVLTVKEVT